MSSKVYTIQEIQNILHPIFDNWALNKVWLFGSYAQGTANTDSDVDLRIEGGRMKGLFGFGSFRNDMESALQKPIDIITDDGTANSLHRGTTEKFMANVHREGRLIYERQG